MDGLAYIYGYVYVCSLCVCVCRKTLGISTGGVHVRCHDVDRYRSPIEAVRMLIDTHTWSNPDEEYLTFEHVFSVEVVPFKQACISRNTEGCILFNNMLDLPRSLSQMPTLSTCSNLVVRARILARLIPLKVIPVFDSKAIVAYNLSMASRGPTSTREWVHYFPDFPDASPNPTLPPTLQPPHRGESSPRTLETLDSAMHKTSREIVYQARGGGKRSSIRRRR
ncbi:hypothetical protein F4821DRAFT_261241 [Hypoxylon rubiginosum]|uniref:Uncharacterized protein n=1 Tax=Hypoxylon rubiginosum TaxID=110542 RepID=A0ACC0CYP9_9PEZI|nr:hypothetical protein F4821DRAFT_261241 [Hypoxylon rubiginosum]